MRDEVIHSRLVHYFVTSKAYRDPDIRLEQIADRIHTNKTYTSTVINHRYKMNVKTLLNRMRLEEAKEILKSRRCEEVAIREIFTRVGFRSKSVFNNFFKDETGMTPKEYRNRALNGGVSDSTNLPKDYCFIDLDSILLV